MALNHRNIIVGGDEGYTLVESLVSLALVVAVLIPLGVTLGTFVLSQEGSQVNQALQLAQTEMNNAFLQQHFLPEKESTERVFLIHRTTETKGDLVTIRVSVSLTKRTQRPLVTIQKSMVIYP
jgi:type II secretory pathway pseudopilin PulG